jgi:PPOX class probable FMN-dependent enzyme
MTIIQSVDELEAIYRTPPKHSLLKEVDHITDEYAAYIEASPFAAFATAGPGGLDCTPRGDAAGFVRVRDRHTLLMPDRRGNNRIDSLRNLIDDPRASLMFLVPGSPTVLRVNGRAQISVDPELLQSFAVEGKAPRTVIVMAVEAVYFQCARAVNRARLWDAETFVDPKSLPSVGTILEAISKGGVDGEAYDAEWPGRAAKTMW